MNNTETIISDEKLDRQIQTITNKIDELDQELDSEIVSIMDSPVNSSANDTVKNEKRASILLKDAE